MPEPVNVAEYEALAAEALDEQALAYFAGGANDEVTLRNNVAAWGHWQLRPRLLAGIDDVTTAATVLGREASMPVAVAPVAFQRLAHADGEPAMARAAASAGTVMSLSTIATARPSEVAAAAPGARRWYQLYCFRDAAVTQALLDEAVESSFEAILLTVDAPRGGRRERDLRLQVAVPADVSVPSLDAALGAGQSVSIAEVFAQIDPSLGWEDMERLASGCSLPLLVKGLLTAEDASLAVEHGAAGVVVSNHGGRQLDNVPASAEALPEIVEAVAGRVPVMVDGGIRRGTDVLVALALGAEAVLVGRPVLWGLAVNGEEGAHAVLEMLRAEVELALALCGCASPADVTREHVQRAPAPSL
jgi:isopentenyl diphosphate isomerase/L-lactate dehydrogenase-like FMN-dependent dehydrogenase